jgi:hypothetical protein
VQTADEEISKLQLHLLFHIVQGLAKVRSKKFGINYLWRSELFWIVIFHFSIGKATMNSRPLWKEYLTSIGQGATVFVAAFPIVNEITGALLSSIF